MIEASVDARLGATGTFEPLVDPTPVAVGDAVRTDATGFAEIVYFDGSLTRLDVESEFEVLELVDDIDESVMRTRMGLGRTWHRVQDLGETGTYTVETSVATAVVQGTAFIIECSETACTFTVLEGSIELLLPNGTTLNLGAGEAAMIPADGEPTGPTSVSTDPFVDPWLARNDTLDIDVGFDPIDAGESANDAAEGGSEQYVLSVSGRGVPLFGSIDFSADMILLGGCDGTSPCEIVLFIPRDGPLATGFGLFVDFALEPTGSGYTWSTTAPTIEGACGGGTRVIEGQLSVGPTGPTGSWEQTADGPCAGTTSFTFEPNA